jgi:hypothetical protein
MTLTEFLVEIATDSAERAQFETDPQGYIDSGDISPAHKVLLKRGTDDEVMQELDREAAGNPSPIQEVTTIDDTRGTDNVLRSVQLR